MKEYITQIFNENGGIVKAAVLKEAGISYKSILELMDAGDIERVKNGYYMLPGSTIKEEDLLLKYFPDGVLTMGSALYYYGYLEARPMCWSIAVSKNSSKSRFKQDYPLTEPYYTDNDVLSLGVSEIDFAGGKIKIYNRDRLICDVLKYEERLERSDLRRAAFSYIEDDNKDINKLLMYARKRRVLKKVQGMIGVWL